MCTHTHINHIYIYVYVCVYIYIYIYVHLSLSIYIYIYVCMYVCMYVWRPGGPGRWSSPSSSATASSSQILTANLLTKRKGGQGSCTERSRGRQKTCAAMHSQPSAVDGSSSILALKTLPRLPSRQQRGRHPTKRGHADCQLRPISLLTLWISEGLTRAQS